MLAFSSKHGCACCLTELQAWADSSLCENRKSLHVPVYICEFSWMCVAKWSSRDTRELSEAVRHPWRQCSQVKPRASLPVNCCDACTCVCVFPQCVTQVALPMNHWDSRWGNSISWPVSPPKNTKQELRQMQSGEVTSTRPYANKPDLFSSTRQNDTKTKKKIILSSP